MFLISKTDFAWSTSYIYSTIVFNFIFYFDLKTKKTMFFWDVKNYKKLIFDIPDIPPFNGGDDGVKRGVTPPGLTPS